MPLHYGEEDDMFVDYDVQRERNARLAQWLGYAIAETKRDAVLHEVVCIRMPTLFYLLEND